SRHHARDVRHTLAVADLQAKEIHVGRNADVVAIVTRTRAAPAAAADDAGDEGAVAIVVAPPSAPGDAVDDLLDARGANRAVCTEPTEVGQGIVDARIQDRY